MKNRSVFYVIIIAIAVAVLAGFYASSNPDGLEKVAGNLKFENKSSSTSGLFSGYGIPFITNNLVSSLVAGIFGILLIVFIFRSIASSRHIAKFLSKISESFK